MGGSGKAFAAAIKYDPASGSFALTRSMGPVAFVLLLPRATIE